MLIKKIEREDTIIRMNPLILDSFFIRYLFSFLNQINSSTALRISEIGSPGMKNRTTSP